MMLRIQHTMSNTFEGDRFRIQEEIASMRNSFTMSTVHGQAQQDHIINILNQISSRLQRTDVNVAGLNSLYENMRTHITGPICHEINQLSFNSRDIMGKLGALSQQLQSSAPGAPPPPPPSGPTVSADQQRIMDHILKLRSGADINSRTVMEKLENLSQQLQSSAPGAGGPPPPPSGPTVSADQQGIMDHILKLRSDADINLSKMSELQADMDRLLNLLRNMQSSEHAMHQQSVVNQIVAVAGGSIRGGCLKYFDKKGNLCKCRFDSSILQSSENAEAICRAAKTARESGKRAKNDDAQAAAKVQAETIRLLVAKLGSLTPPPPPPTPTPPTPRAESSAASAAASAAAAAAASASVSIVLQPKSDQLLGKLCGAASTIAGWFLGGVPGAIMVNTVAKPLTKAVNAFFYRPPKPVVFSASTDASAAASAAASAGHKFSSTTAAAAAAAAGRKGGALKLGRVKANASMRRNHGCKTKRGGGKRGKKLIGQNQLNRKSKRHSRGRRHSTSRRLRR